MSSIQINFLRQRHKQLTLLQKADRRTAVTLSYVTAGVVVGSIIVFGLQLFLSASLTSVKKQQSGVASQIASLASVEQEYLILAQKFTQIKNFMKGKTIQQEAIEYFSTLFAQQQVTLNEVSRERDGIISFRISAPNIFQLEQVVSFLQTKDVLTKYPSLVVSNVSREKTGVYHTNIFISLPLLSPTPAPKKTIKALPDTLK